MDDRQRLEAIVSVVCEYLPPDGISKDDALNKIIALVDPLPPAQPPSEQEKAEPVAWRNNSSGALSATLRDERLWTPLYTAPKSAPSASPLTDEKIWKDDEIMSANSAYGANFETLRELVRAVEAAHGIGAKP